MKIKTLEYTLKKGLPNYSSVSAGMTVEIGEGENLSQVWDTIKAEIGKQCNEDPSWINEKQPNEPGYVKKNGADMGDAVAAKVR